MKYRLEPTKALDPKDLPLSNYDILHDVMNSCVSQIVRERDIQIIDHLKKCGFEFETRQELESFAKTRCKIEMYDNKLNRLLVDNKPILEWWNIVETKREDNIVTAIAGNPPSNYL